MTTTITRQTTGTECRIRTFAQEDQPAIQQMFRRVHRAAMTNLADEMRARMAISIESEISDHLNDIARRYDAAPNECYVLAQEDRVAGFAALVSRPDGRAELKNLVVDTSAQGAGGGRMLMDRFEGRARELGYDEAVLWTYGHLQKAISMYARRGWTAIPLYNDLADPGLDPVALQLQISDDGRNGQT